MKIRSIYKAANISFYIIFILQKRGEISDEIRNCLISIFTIKVEEIGEDF